MSTETGNDIARLKAAKKRINIWLDDCRNTDTIQQTFFLYQELCMIHDEINGR